MLKQLEDRLQGLAATLARRPSVQRLFASLDKQQHHRATIRRDSRGHPAAVIATWLVLIGIGVFFAQNVSRHIEWPPAAYSDPRVFNLTHAGVIWDTYVGPPESCGLVDCHVLESTADDRFQTTASLPYREFPMPGFRKGQTVYHRTVVRLPPALQADDSILIFHSVYVWAKRYEFYINGVLVDVGDSSLLNIAIPRHLIGEGGRLSLGFKIDPGNLPYQGLSHFGDLVIGPKGVLDDLKYTAREIRTTYFLWYLLPRLTIGMLFCFLFLAMSKNAENFILFLFVLMSSVRIFLVTDYATSILPDGLSGATLGRVADLYETLLFVLFVHRYFRRHSPPFERLIRFAFLAAPFVGVAIVVAMREAPGLRVVVDRSGDALRLVGVGYACWLAGTTALYLAHNGKSRARLIAASFMTLFLCASFVGFVWEAADLIPVQFKGVYSYTHELLVCIVLAGLVAMEFAWTISQRDHIRSKFRTLVDARVADELLMRPEILRGESREVTVLFADIRSFTTISEVYPAGEVVAMLNEYFEAMIDVISAHGGVVDKLIGDAIMAVWGAPVATDRDAELAVSCAVEMRRALGLLNRRREAEGKFPISIGVGVHSGRAVAGGVGASQRLDYTVIGDPVNAAARIESLSKDLEADIVVSGSTLDLVRGVAVVAPCGTALVKGKSRAVEVYRLIGVFDRQGRYHCYDEAYAAMPQPQAAGVIDCEIRNLVTRTYASAADPAPAEHDAAA